MSQQLKSHIIASARTQARNPESRSSAPRLQRHQPQKPHHRQRDDIREHSRKPQQRAEKTTPSTHKPQMQRADDTSHSINLKSRTIASAPSIQRHQPKSRIIASAPSTTRQKPKTHEPHTIVPARTPCHMLILTNALSARKAEQRLSADAAGAAGDLGAIVEAVSVSKAITFKKQPASPLKASVGPVRTRKDDRVVIADSGEEGPQRADQHRHAPDRRRGVRRHRISSPSGERAEHGSQPPDRRTGSAPRTASAYTAPLDSQTTKMTY